MAYTIISESYGPRKPKIICTADSLDDLANLDCAEGSEATVGGTKYVLDRVNGWVEPGGGGGGSELPAVTSDDNGDVLTVVEGAWGKATPSGGSLVVGCVSDPTFQTTDRILDKSYNEITAAIRAGKAVTVRDDLYETYYFLASCVEEEHGYSASIIFFNEGTPIPINFWSDTADGVFQEAT